MSDEVVCKKPELEEECKPKCIKFLAEYQACAERVQADTTGARPLQRQSCAPPRRAGDTDVTSGGGRGRCCDHPGEPRGRPSRRPTGTWASLLRCPRQTQRCAHSLRALPAAGEAHCTGQYFDYWRCVDKCVAPKLFKHLK
ncbi:unnamed protein product [Pedinophyceae sp. YPF-701]|nr:unnamed protein product [Pedinophyceae sp. YPF-701]